MRMRLNWFGNEVAALILKAVNNTSKSLRECYEYVSDPVKSNNLCDSYGCGSSDPVAAMMAVKRVHNKCGGVQCAHFVLSPAPEDQVSDSMMLEIADDFTRLFKKHQSVFAVHTNTDNIHAHIILNSVGFDGTRFRQYKPQLAEIKNYVSGYICPKYSIVGITGSIIKGHASSDEDMEILTDDFERLIQNSAYLEHEDSIDNGECDFSDDGGYYLCDAGEYLSENYEKPIICEDDYALCTDKDYPICNNSKKGWFKMKNNEINFFEGKSPSFSNKRIRVFNNFKVVAESASEAAMYSKELMLYMPNAINQVRSKCGDNVDIYNSIEVNVNAISGDVQAVEPPDVQYQEDDCVPSDEAYLMSIWD